MFSVSGIYSGLDINTLVNSLVEAERTPIEGRLTRKENAANVELSAIGQLKSALEVFQTQLENMDTEAELSPFSHTVTDESVLSATVSSAAAMGTYTLFVDQLASNHQLVSDSIIASDTIGTGDATFFVNGEFFTVTLTSGTLTELRDAINNASDNIGVDAAIVNDGGGQRLMLTGQNTGSEYTIGTDFSGLTGGSVTLNEPLIELEAAQDASIRFGSGGSAVTITSKDNTLENVIDGVTINLKAVSANPQTLEISQDTSALKTRINELVDAWNTLEDTFDSLTSYDGTTAGPLNGDSQIRLLKRQLRQEFGALFGDSGDTLRSLGDMGLNFSSDGSLSINASRLDDAINNNYDQLITALTQTGVEENSFDSLVLSGMTNSVYNETFIDAGVNGVVVGNVFFENNFTEMYKHETGSGSWYVAFDNGSGSWTVGESTTDPATWVNFDAVNLSNQEIFSSASEFENGLLRADSSDSNIAYSTIITSQARQSGLINRLSAILDNDLGTGGNLARREESINEQLKQVEDDREDLAIRLEKVRTYYQNQFTQMEALLASLSGTNEWLTNNLQNFNQ
ncbi:MAG: flagellar filament capping protein FliD [Endozoicomonas sp. (ex Botrylloides leachii)]|nr:flagellar filament capping protein FliD [Endozoicomonas sp. (ex Botrylloides leachii)]